MWWVGLWALLPPPAWGQTVYRCGAAGNSYSQLPCADGRPIEVSDPRSDAQVAEARASLRAQERWAMRAARERRAEQAAHPPALAGGIGPLAKPADQPAVAKRKPGRGHRAKGMAPVREGDFMATSPAPAPAAAKPKRGER